MRSTLFMLLTFVIACTGPKHAGSSKIYNGTWIPFSEEFGGKQIPKASFETQKLVINDTDYTFTAESIDKGIVKRNGDKMDIYGKIGVNAGKHFTALCKMENGELTICYNLAGDSYPENFDTRSKPAFFLCMYKKQ